MDIAGIVEILNAGVPFAIVIMLYLTIRLEQHVADCMKNHEELIRRMLEIIAVTEAAQADSQPPPRV